MRRVDGEAEEVSKGQHTEQAPPSLPGLYHPKESSFTAARSSMHRFLLARRALVAAGAAGVSTAASCEPVGPERKRTRSRPRVLITGFHDWRELQANIWRCRDNPSCRLLLGSPSAAPAIERDGPLLRALKDNAACKAEFTCQTLPVLWGTAAGLDLLSFDVVIHLGLGVYDRHDTIIVERGAFNMRKSIPDAIGHTPKATNTSGTGAVIEGAAPECLSCLHMQPRYEALAREPAALVSDDARGPFVVLEAPARDENTYICNETHWRALRAVEHASKLNGRGGTEARLRAAYFLHLPYPRERDPDHEQLAVAVAELVSRIVRVEERLGDEV
jgi:hypothetical protein